MALHKKHVVGKTHKAGHPYFVLPQPKANTVVATVLSFTKTEHKDGITRYWANGRYPIPEHIYHLGMLGAMGHDLQPIPVPAAVHALRAGD